ncbi:MAG TPA: hypothetical protein PLQ12_03510, partial [Candidatus Defluviicoccus seviourii]|nr:hypothetical protein [Candidatus Defluviicoccus seviourii]
MLHLTKEAPEVASGFGRYMLALMRATNREITEFSDSCLIAAQVAMQGARDNPLDMMQALEVLQHNQALMTKGVLSAQEKMMDYVFDQVEEGMQAAFNTLFNVEGEKISGYINREAGVMESVANFNEQINKIKDEFGFHFNSGNYKLVHETDTFQMYQVLPLKADPYAFKSELRPSTASIVAGTPDHIWGDARHRDYWRKADARREAVSIYEVHAGSWQRDDQGDFLTWDEMANRLIPYV